jgi:O-antigen/teichoic acid export membrane protein
MAPEADARHPAKQAGALVLGTTLATISSALLPLLLVRLLGKAHLAELMALLLIYETVALILTLGFPQTLMYHISDRPAPERRAIAVRIGWLTAGLGALAALMAAALGATGNALPGTLASNNDARISLYPLLILAPSLIFELPSRIVPNLLIAEQRAPQASALAVVRTIALTLATLVPVSLGQSIWVVVAWYAGCRALLGLSLPWAIRSCFRGVEAIRCPIAPREMFRFALPLGATDMVALLNQQFDRWLILLSFPAAAFADYQAGAWQVPVISTIAYSVGAAYMPTLVAAFGRGAPLEALATWRATILKVSLIVLPVTMAFVVGARELMELLFTKDYLNAAPIFQLYSVLTLGRVAAFGSVIVAAGRPRYVLQAALLSLTANVAFAIPLTMAIGFIGPALAAVLAFIPTVVFYVWSIGRAAGVPTGHVFPLLGYLRVLLLACLAGAAAYVLKEQLPEGAGLRLLVTVAVTLLVFLVAGLASGTLERADLRFARDWLKVKLS